jgi:hypothetical protein
MLSPLLLYALNLIQRAKENATGSDLRFLEKAEEDIRAVLERIGELGEMRGVVDAR